MSASVLQETLFILQNAGLFRTQTGDVYQVTGLLQQACAHELEVCCLAVARMYSSLIAGYRYRRADLAKRNHLSSRRSIRCTIQNRDTQ